MCLFSLYFLNVTPLSSDLEHAIKVWWQSYFLSFIRDIDFLIWCPKGFFFFNLKINNFTRLCLGIGHSGKILPGMPFQYVVQISLFLKFQKSILELQLVIFGLLCNIDSHLEMPWSSFVYYLCLFKNSHELYNHFGQWPTTYRMVVPSIFYTYKRLVC